MAIAVGDILSFTVVQALFQQQVLNIWTYRLDSFETNVNYDDLADQFNTLVLTDIKAIQSTYLMYSSIIIKNLTNGLDIHEELAAGSGSVGVVECMPSFVSYGFRLNRATALTRHGSKRIAGVPESFVAGNALATAAETLVPAAAVAMAEPVMREDTAEDFVLTPVIVGRYPVGSPNAGQYDLSKVNEVNGAQFIRITTQTTRRAGRGA